MDRGWSRELPHYLGALMPCLGHRETEGYKQKRNVKGPLHKRNKPTMKTLLKLAFIAALCLPAVAQTQSWITVVASSPIPQQSLTLNVSLPAGAIYRFVSLNGKATTPITVTTAQMVSSWDDGLNGHPADPDAGVAKAMQVLQTSAALSVSLIDSSVNPAKTSTVTVVALPPVTYKFSCTFPGPATGPMPSSVTLTCSKAVLQ